MFSRWKYVCLSVMTIMILSCSTYSKLDRIRSGELRMGLGISDEKPLEEDRPNVDSIRSTLAEGPILMNAIRDSETGEMVATDVINASKVMER